jgi:hypothetical protein
MAGKNWAVFAGGARMIDRLDWQEEIMLLISDYACPYPQCILLSLTAWDAVHMYEILSRGASQEVIWGQVPQPSAHMKLWDFPFCANIFCFFLS